MTDRQLIDTVAGFSLPANTYHNELGTIYSLWCGLSFIAGQVSWLENVARNSPGGSSLVCFSADLESSFGLPAGANSLLPCFYHWFGNTVVNMVRMIGLLRGRQDGVLDEPPYSGNGSRKKIKTYCSNYVEAVSEIKEVLVWRNKVFAHFAVTDPFATDNLALLEQNSFYPVSYSNGKLPVGAWQVFHGDFDPSSNLPPLGASGLPSWALTEVAEKLTERYKFYV